MIGSGRTDDGSDSGRNDRCKLIQNKRNTLPDPQIEFEVIVVE